MAEQKQGHRMAAAAAVAAALLLAGAGPVPGAPAPAARALEEASPSVVPVRFQLRPKERPRGGEGQKVRRVLCGVAAGPPGQIVLSGDFFPDIDDGPAAMVPFDFRIVLPDGEEVPAEAIGVDRELNLAFLQADPAMLKGVRPAAFDHAVEASVGDELVIVGLLPQDYNFTRVFYTARVNAVLRKPRKMYSLDRPVEDLAIGGLVLKRDGRALGIVGEDLITEGGPDSNPPNVLSLIPSLNQGPRAGYPMVFPYSVIARSLASPPRLQDERLETRGWLGVVMQPLSRPLAEYWSIDAPGGVIITAVVDDSPASVAGLRPGDVIIGVDGQELPIREQSDLRLMQRRIRSAGAGRAIPLAVWREGSVKGLEVQLASSPLTASTAEEFESEVFGVKVRALTFDYLQSVNLSPDTAGVLVVDLERAGWSQVAGVQRRDIVQKINGEPTPDPASFRAALERVESERAREAIFFVLRDYKTQFIRVKTDWRRR